MSAKRAGPAPSERNRSAPRFIVGIDLGTTNSALAFVDTAAGKVEDAPAKAGGGARVTSFEIPQLTKPGHVDALPTLPSFLYIASEHELSKDQRELPWGAGAVTGVLAREYGGKVPARLVSSAKSWLCHPGVDRRGAILPWQSDPTQVEKLSPLDAQARYLEHLRSAWDHAIAKGDASLALAKQEIYLCVPASFDAVARELTVEAAARAGLERVTLLEEPQAAFYAWLDRSGDRWRKALAKGDLVLVADVGGGTTDFTLISVGEEDGNLILERTAVGEHLLLGGDNMDVALAHVLAERLKKQGHELDAWQSRGLWYACRVAKEQLLADREKASAPVVVLGRGAKLIGGTIKTELTRDDVARVLVDGFFPRSGPLDRPVLRRSIGLQEIGLPFEPDAAVTKHLARFLGRHVGNAKALARPTALLFNGGVFKSLDLRARLLEVLDGWLEHLGSSAVKVLEGEDLDLAVARGAAYYGLVRRGRGVRIRGGTAQSYYVGFASAMPAVPGLPPPLKAVCVAPFGMEEGSEVALEGRELALLVGEPAVFRFLGSTVRQTDAAGAVVERWDEGELHELAPLETTLPASKKDGDGGETIPVKLHSRVTEIGTLEVACVARDGRRWKLEWNVREHEESGPERAT